MMVPHVVQEIRDGEGALVSDNEPKVWKTVVDPSVARTMHDAMLGVVQNGSAKALAVPGFEVGGKTGTAQLGTEPPQSHTWIIGFGGPPGDPQVAVAVIVERQPGASEATGGRVAAPIGQAVLQQALKPIPQAGGGGD
jgi:peptidoglycan glycosyltransferase